MNLLLSLEAFPDDSGIRSLRRVCLTNEEREKAVELPESCTDGVIRFSTIDSVRSQSSEGIHGTGGTGVRRRLFPGSNEKGKGVQGEDMAYEPDGQRIYTGGGRFSDCGEGTSGGERAQRENSMELWPDTNISGIIRLPEASTPSASEDIPDGNVVPKMLGAEMYGNAVPEMTAAEMYGNTVSETPIAEMNAEDNCNSEDERVLREFEAIEERERQLAKDKGKGVVTETEDLNLECDDCYTDGLNGSSSDSDDHYGNCNWSDYLHSEYPQDNGDCGLEEAGPSEVPVPQDGECRRMPDDPDSLLQR